MDALLAAVRAMIAAQQMITAGPPLVVAVSGGPDSLCLLHVLRALQAELAVPLHVAHLDHMLRGAESAAEARRVAELAHAWGLPATLAATDVAALAARRGLNVHAAGRVARYELLARVARAVGAQAVATAHHADDQAETVLLHLLRGAGPEGLRGMRPVLDWREWAGDEARWPPAPPAASTAGHHESSAGSAPRRLAAAPSLIRPLLASSRAEIERYCTAHGLVPQHDPSNHDLSATRNRIRHELIPHLIDYNPHIVAALGRTARICAEQHEFLEAALDAAWPGLVQQQAGSIAVDGAAWRSLHPALQRAALRRAFTQLAGSNGATLTLEHVEQARALVGRGVGRRLELPGGVALTVGYGGFTLGAPIAPAAPQLAAELLPLPERGHVELGGGWCLSITPGAVASTAGRWALALDAERLAGPLVLRRRRAGERLQLEPGAGSRRMQDIFVDAKVPRELRAAWPIVATADAPLWVVGVRAAGTCRATAASRHVILLEVTHAGAPAR